MAPGGVTLCDLLTPKPVPERFADREFHIHNRLIACAALNPGERAQVARRIAAKLNAATGPTAFLMPLKGIDEWDKPGGPFHDDEGLALFADTMRTSLEPPVEIVELDAHINDDDFAAAAMQIFDRWLDDGTIERKGETC